MTNPTGIETDPVIPTTDSADGADVRVLTVHSPHLRLLQISLQDQTDHHNELVHEREWLLHTSEVNLRLTGNLFIIEEPFQDRGWVWVKTVPLPHVRQPACPLDLRVERIATGFSFRFHPDPGGSLDAWTCLPYTGGPLARTRVLQDWQRAQRPDTPSHRVPAFLSNTWGDRNRDARITHDFIRQEIDAAADLGVDIVQIDDGWQIGVSSNSIHSQTAGGVWEGFYAQNPDFWAPHPERLPHGLQPLVDRATDRGVQLGLWFAPDSAHDFANYQRDIDTLLTYYRSLGIRYFKVDGIKARTPAAHANLQRFFDGVRQGSDGHIVLDLDITAEVRPGYFGAISVGTLFVENRYSDWHNYWPHFTLRNLWSLAPWVDPARLRMEFLNQARNQHVYPDDPLAPAAYRPDALFASVMYSNPLGWFEVSSLPASYREQIAPLAATWREHRDALFASAILPIGQRPDGRSYTGFLAVSPDEAAAYLLLFRGLRTADSYTLPLPMPIAGHQRVEILAGSGRASVENGSVTVTGTDERHFTWLKLS